MLHSRPEEPPQNYTEEVIPENTQAESHAHNLHSVKPTDVNDTSQTLVGPEGNNSPPALAGPEGNMETLPSPEPPCSGRIRRGCIRQPGLRSTNCAKGTLTLVLIYLQLLSF